MPGQERRQPSGGPYSDHGSLGPGGLLVSSDVRLGVGAWDARSAEVLLGLSVLGSSQEESVGTYKAVN